MILLVFPHPLPQTHGAKIVHAVEGDPWDKNAYFLIQIDVKGIPFNPNRCKGKVWTTHIIECNILMVITHISFNLRRVTTCEKC